MAIINDALLYFFSYFGILIGIFIAGMAKEEIKQGHTLLLILKQILILIIIGISLYYLDDNISLFLVGLAFGLLLGYFFREIYFYLGIAMASSFLVLHELVISSLIFLVGLPHGSLMLHLKKKDLHIHLIKSLIFFSIPSLLLFFSIDMGILIGVMTGGLIYELKWPYS
ncbi:hypothetical protein HYX17_01330 [Candidatus Woesearchaeota archaeon]|nr:hypothetical protein [Candidatus Woesearchaeota archaeon]